jgi:hypothetical protein
VPSMHLPACNHLPCLMLCFQPSGALPKLIHGLMCMTRMPPRCPFCCTHLTSPCVAAFSW